MKNLCFGKTAYHKGSRLEKVTNVKNDKTHKFEEIQYFSKNDLHLITIKTK